MSRMTRLFAVLFCCALAPPAVADDGGSFLLTLGQDTTSVERYRRTKDRLEVDQVGRAPRLLRRQIVYEFKDGVFARLSMVVTPPGSPTPTQTIADTVDGDTLRGVVQTGTAAPVRSAIALPRGALVVAGTSPWAVYEREVQRLVQSRADTLGGRVHFLGTPNTERYRIERLGADSVSLWISRGDLIHARIDKQGRMLGTRALAGTFRVALSRIAPLDIEAVAAGYKARESSGGSLGTLSPRDTIRTTAASAANITIDYGRPAKRGRVVFGNLVPYGALWRTGANAATQFRTDKPLNFGGSTVPAGFYSLWTIPGPTGWKLIINSETGQPGTAHKPDRDVFTIDMNVSTLPQVVERFTISIEAHPTGGFLHLDWDATRASANFTLKAE